MKIFSCNANNSNSTHSLISCNVPPKLCSTLVSLRTRSKRIGGPKREHLTPSIRIPRLILFSRKRVFKTVWYRLRNREIHALDSPFPLSLSLSLSATRHHKISAIAERKRSHQRTTIVQNRLFSRRSTTLFTVCARTISRVATNEYKTCQQPWEVDEERFRASVCALIEQPDEEEEKEEMSLANIRIYLSFWIDDTCNTDLLLK